MAQNTEYTKIKESTLSAFFSKLKSAFWNKADVMNVSLADIAVTGQLADATQDSTHRTVTDTDIVNWNNAVPITTTINGQALTSNIVLTANDVNALPASTTIPSKLSDLTNDAGYLTQHQDISGKANSADLATVATSGSYNDLSNKPTIPTVPTNVSAFTNDAGYLTSETPEVQINGTPASGIKLLVDETADASVEVYSKAQVDAMIANIYLILINNGLTV